jgi:hypothetical protein
MPDTTYVYPVHQFVQATDYRYFQFGCGEEDKYCLPIISRADHYFQILVTDLETEPTQNIKVTFYAVPIPADSACSIGELLTPELWSGNVIRGQFFSTFNDDYEAIVNFNQPIGTPFDFSNPGIDLAVGECFKYMIVERLTDGEGNFISQKSLGCTNCFKIEEEPQCYMTQFEYFNNENSVGFRFKESTTSQSNQPFTFRAQALLPAWIHSPEITTEQQSYTFSDGTARKLSGRLRKKYKFETDYLPMSIQLKLGVAMQSDSLLMLNRFIFDINYPNVNRYICEGEYEYNWSGREKKATVKMQTEIFESTSIPLVNNNCS